MNKALFTAVATSVLALTACKQSGTTVSNNQTQGTTDEAAIENSGLSGNMADSNMSTAETAGAAQAYVQDAATSDMFEIQSSQIALEKATLPAVKTYAQMMIDEHGKSTTELKAAAQAAGLTVPAALPADKQSQVEALRALSGAGFDQRYLADQRAGHQDTLAKVNSYLATAAAGPLKDHAAKVTGVVQKHLNALEKIK